ncbi:helix-turn-helix transcriptional regulator [Microbacterium ureisolvens]|uniref:Helix-turn-helix transcriptional regulator n=1 Tax=Microbacterium ureisolvens TaxID=2781186 RepID=A0ABS7HYY6_9MICO|nr:helix-turn-helix transcriptional regulator [Microbacterium ureisolvens]MBW9110283.1 helix-turn-helix transcriptional regulator [Microbacterium ureisolvens]
MGSILAAERARGDVDVLSRAALDLDEFMGEATAAIRRAVPWEGACVGTHDPATAMLTSGRKYGSLVGSDTHDALFATLEYNSPDQSSFRSLARSDHDAIGMRVTLPDDIARSERMNVLMRPQFGFSDEARLVFRDGQGMWGGLALFRGHDDAWFTEDDIAFLASLSGSMARGVRAGVLARLTGPALVDAGTGGPAVVIVDAADEVTHISVGAEERLAQLHASEHLMDPLGLVHALVAAARASLHTPGAPLPRARIRTASGMWLVVHAAPLAARDGSTSQVVVTIEEARPPEIVELVVAAFGLTPRERDVTRLVLQGVETKEIATTLHVSAYTVQDHLKAVFDKAGVRSRRDLISRIYFDQYVPRLGTAVSTSGWFAD